MGLYKYLQQSWKKPSAELSQLYRTRLIEWRRANSVVTVDNPTRLDRARSLGYKAKQGYIIARVRLLRGGRQRPLIKKGRRSKHNRRMKIVGKSYQWVAEERANKRYPNCEVLNSYYLAKDGRYYWYEVILADRELVSKYAGMEWLKSNTGRVYRGITSAGRKSRGLRGKGRGHEKMRPSLAAHGKRGKN